MKFLCLVYFEPETLAALSPSEKATLNCNSLAYNEELTQSNLYISAEALQPVQTARTVRGRQGKASITDGPFAETKEQLGGYYLIEAKDQKEAEAIAERIPSARWGSIEVRPIIPHEMPG